MVSICEAASPAHRFRGIPAIRLRWYLSTTGSRVPSRHKHQRHCPVRCVRGERKPYEQGASGQHRARSWGLRRRLGLGRRARRPHEGRLSRERHAESDDIARRRRGRDETGNGTTGRSRDTRRPLLRRRRHYRDRNRSARAGTRLHCGVCARRRRVCGVIDQESTARSSRSAHPPSTGWLSLSRR